MELDDPLMENRWKAVTKAFHMRERIWRMQRTEVLLAAGVLALTGLALGCNGGSSSAEETQATPETVTVTGPSSGEPAGTVTISVPPKVSAAKVGPGAPERLIEFGHIASLKRGEEGFVLRFDPAEYLTGLTASDAALEDTGSNDVPNDSYVVDEGHRLFTYRVPANAHVTVLADGVEETPITVAQLAKLVKGGNPLGHPLFEPLETGVWILVRADTVRSIDQQYVP
jgi:hypothetical protein